jgi:hypothetical protein
VRNSRTLFEKASRLASVGAEYLKAEFEAEGSRREEVTALRASTRKADLGLTLKIGGCEAVTDLRDAIEFQAEVIVAPMIESAYAVQKFDEAVDSHEDVREEATQFLVNVETIGGLNNLDAIIGAVSTSRNVSGIVFGRVDFVRSQGLGRDAVDSDECLEAALKVAAACQSSNLSLVLGGAISASSERFLLEVAKVKLNRFETRKVVFDAEVLSRTKLSDLLNVALDFELSWLASKRDYYHAISVEDSARIQMLEERLAGGSR